MVRKNMRKLFIIAMIMSVGGSGLAGYNLGRISGTKEVLAQIRGDDDKLLAKSMREYSIKKALEKVYAEIQAAADAGSTMTEVVLRGSEEVARVVASKLTRNGYSAEARLYQDFSGATIPYVTVSW